MRTAAVRVLRLGGTAVIALAGVGGATALATPAGASPTCTPTGFVRDNINLTAALVDPTRVSGTVDATGCNIGVYYGPGASGQVSHADIYGANYFGVVNNGASVNVLSSDIHNIGEVPFNGTQHGVAVYWVFGAPSTGKIIGNTISQYQKGGVTVNGGSATIQHNKVTGLGRVDFIAANGIQVANGASADVSGNTVSDNAYTGANEASSTGILVFGGCGYALTPGISIHNNTLINNDVGIYAGNYNPADNSCASQAVTPTDVSIHNNTLSNDAQTNTSGNGCSPACQGYQAGITDIGDGDSIHNNKISGVGYTPAVDSPTIFVTPIDTSLATNATVHNNAIR